MVFYDSHWKVSNIPCLLIASSISYLTTMLQFSYYSQFLNLVRPTGKTNHNVNTKNIKFLLDSPSQGITKMLSRWYSYSYQTDHSSFSRPTDCSCRFGRHLHKWSQSLIHYNVKSALLTAFCNNTATSQFKLNGPSLVTSWLPKSSSEAS